MTKRLDAATPREYESNGETKTNWTRIGVAFQRDNGNIDVLLNALPLPGPDGQAKIVLMEPRDNGNQQSRQQSQSRQRDDDYVPGFDRR